MPIRLPEKYQRALEERLSAQQRERITRTYRRQRIIATTLLSALTLSGAGFVVKDFADSRLSAVEATNAVNQQDALQEDDDVIFYSGQTIEQNTSLNVDKIADFYLDEEMVNEPEPESDAPVESRPSDAPRTVVESDNILLVGMDSRAGANGEIGAGTAADITGTRTDSIMFLHIPKSGGQPSVVSFPRDLNVQRQDCVAWNGTGYTSSTVGERADVKINSLYGAGGPRCLVRTVQEITGMKINRFVSVDFTGFQGIVDALGGIDIETDRPIIDGTLGPIIEEPGVHTLDGETALDYVRARSVEGDTRGDYDRIERQQRFGMAVLATMTSRGTLSNPAVLNDLAKAIHSAISGENIDSGFILDILGRADEFQESGVHSMTIPTTGTVNGNEIMDEQLTSQMMVDIATN